MTVRTRFAPSPTGYLHIGGARTALFNYLYARHAGGKFLLRIEDSDVQRSTEESVQGILEGMRWLGLNWDEGPFFQSSLFDLHREEAKKLLDRGLAYRCYCTPEELEERRTRALKEGRPPMYDRRCRDRGDRPDQPFAVRFKVPQGTTSFRDLIKGKISFDNSTIEDFVLLRSDSTPTYNLSVVVDDTAMKITHVIRGDDHINNTPKQILLYRALSYEVPAFAHLPMILGSDRTRLSKRHGAASVTAYRDMGILPHALVNYLARLGWSSGDEEVFSLEELIEKFTLESVGKSSGVFNPEKLLWLNQHYIKESTPGDLKEAYLAQLKGLGVDASGDPRVPAVIKTLQERAKTLKEMAESSLFFFKEEISYDEKAARKFLTADRAALFEDLIKRLAALDAFTEDAVEGVFSEILAEKGLKLGKLAQPVRVALTGTTISPGIFETIVAMGRDLVLKRLARAVSFISENAGGTAEKTVH
ncbi:MAG: glutamate--tRNA ligase [Thermodesulfobacteriota bacterium]|nr:MAG: glutamate--tRNA ligase [Thermodesulfobacteriota bacterium]